MHTLLRILCVILLSSSSPLQPIRTAAIHISYRSSPWTSKVGFYLRFYNNCFLIYVQWTLVNTAQAFKYTQYYHLKFISTTYPFYSIDPTHLLASKASLINLLHYSTQPHSSTARLVRSLYSIASAELLNHSHLYSTNAIQLLASLHICQSPLKYNFFFLGLQLTRVYYTYRIYSNSNQASNNQPQRGR